MNENEFPLINIISFMRKYIIFLLLGLFIVGCTRKQTCETLDMSNTDFVYLKNGIFQIREQPFFPMMLNYVVEFRAIHDNFVLSPIKAYEDPDSYETHTRQDIKNQLSGHLQLMEELGFNTVRICMDRIRKSDEGHYYYPTDERQPVFIEKDTETILNELEHFVSLAKEHHLRVMLLIRPPIDNKELKSFTIKLLSRFQDNPVIFAYDFMNEPLYFDSEPNRDKKDAYRIVSEWKEMMCRYAPKQLFTIGFSEPIEVFEWDPFILPVDFIQMHTYHPLRVPNELYWYSRYAGKPWMVGETALPADDSLTSYEDQRKFMQDAYRYTVDCGGIGYGWWEFQDIPGLHFEAGYTGLLNHKGFTETADKKHIIKGSLKPAAYEVKNLRNYTPKPPVRPINFYNMLGYNNIVLHGKIIHEKTNQPIEGALIRGWNEYWSVGMNTYTNEQGEFTLYSNDRCIHFEISAPGMEKIRFDNTNILYYSITSGSISMEQLPNKELEYHDILYNAFVVGDSSLFLLDSTAFHQAKWRGDLGTIYLKSWR